MPTKSLTPEEQQRLDDAVAVEESSSCPVFYDEGGITIYHGDCREVLPVLGAFDVLLTDPPYGVDLASGWNGKHGKCRIRNDGDTDLRDFVIDWHDGRAAIVFGSWRKPKPDCTRAVLIWDKGGHSGMGNLAFPWKPNFEEIYVLGEGFSGKRDTSILSWHIHPTFNAQRTHPTEKPVDLLRRLLVKCPTGSVIDPFMGTGATLVAAKLEGRKAVGIEINESYCESAVRRLRQGVLSFDG